MGRRARIGWDSHSLVAAALIGVCGHAHPLTAQNAAAPADSTALVEGRVIRADRSLVRGATVGVLGAGDSTTTSDSGRFVLRNITPGAHMLWVRGVGFERTRVTVTLTAGRPRSLTVTVAEAVPVSAPVVTTGHVPPGYADVGLDRRMDAGVGQFLTFDQIQHRRASKVSELLRSMRGIEVWIDPKNFDYSVDGTQGMGSCVGYVVDGVPQTQLPPRPGHPGDDADDFIDPSGIGAIEVYSASERPSEFGPGLAERAPPVSGAAPPAIDVKAQRCVLVVIWSRARLGLTNVDTLMASAAAHIASGRVTAKGSAITRGTGVFPASGGRECQALAPTDTTTLNVYTILQSGLGPDARDSAWIRYADGVFAAFRRSFALPNPLPLPVFGYASPALSKTSWKSPGLAVAPTLSTVVAFTLTPTGALLSSSVSVSSLSGEADTSILAAVATAAATHAFPSMPGTASQWSTSTCWAPRAYPTHHSTPS